ncbi:MAG: hypothetical protein F6K21_33390 [Symploca sp. SIO2D2]|nr:hypothetical protein [Symploca sp. SIO2D2]
MTTYVETSDQIPSDDLEKIKKRLTEQINSMSEAELRIAAQSEASLKYFVTELFRSIAQLFGYVVGAVVGLVVDLGRGIGKGFKDGFDAGRGKSPY